MVAAAASIAARGAVGYAMLVGARSPAELPVIDDAAHNDIQQFPSYLDGLAARLNQATDR